MRDDFALEKACTNYALLPFSLLVLVLLPSCSRLNKDSFDVENHKGLSIEGSHEIQEVPSNDPRFYFLKAELALRKGRSDEALSYLVLAEKFASKPSVEIQLQLAQLYLKKDQFDKAIDALNALPPKDQESIEILKLRAGILSTLGRQNEALAIYKKLLEVSKEDREEPTLLLAGMYLQLDNKSEAKKVLETLLKDKPDSFVGNYYLGRLHASLGEHKEAIRYYRKAVAANPSVERAGLEYVQVLVLAGRHEDAVAYSKVMLAYNPTNTKIRQALGELLLSENKVSEAISAFEEASLSLTDPTELLFRVALLKIKQHNFVGAETDLRLLLSRDSDNQAARYYLGSALASSGKINEALQQFSEIPNTTEYFIKARGYGSFLLRTEQRLQEALDFVKKGIEVDQKNISLLGFKATIEKELGEVDAQLATLEQIISLEPENSTNLFAYAVALDEAGEKSKSRQMVEKVLEVDPLHANALNYLGYSLAEKGEDLDRAEELIKKALLIESNNAYFLDSLGWVYFQQKKFNQALVELTKATNLMGEDPVMLDHLGRAQAKVGQNREARETFERALKLLRSEDSFDTELEGSIRELLQSLP